MARSRLLLPLLLAIFALTGCVRLGGGKPPAQLLNLTADAQIAADEGRTITANQAMVIAVPTVPQAIATTRVAVSDGPVIIAYVKDAVWVEAPARLFQRLLAETVSARAGRVVLSAQQLSVDPALAITGQLKAFGVDGAKSEAIIVYEAVMTRDRGKKLTTRRFEAREPMSAVEAVPVGAALNRAANRVAADVAVWVGQ